MIRAVDPKEVLSLCDKALALAEGEREGFIGGACGTDQALLQAVHSVLVAVGNSAEFLEPPEGIQAAGPVLGDRIGDYVITHLLGEGGMGTVYQARRTVQEFDQQVAIKMVRRQLLTPELIGRFDAERKILAQLRHPYIAQLIDGGTADSGAPYLVMEYVDGTPIDVFCDAQLWSIDARLRLIQKVAAAVQAAHQNLVVHRDLKPSNVLVTADGIPKLLDFGIAKLLDPTGREGGGHTTVFGHQALTPDYASPEQILEGKVTTASDVYSLGVLTFELLSGSRPYHIDTRNHLSMVDGVRALTVERPSTRVTGLPPETLRQVAADRATSPERLTRTLAGDLDTLLLKALHHDPAQRYDSVDAFSRDIGRYLANLPIDARADTLRYRFGKFIARNRLSAAAAVVTTLAVLAGLITSLWQADLAREQSQLAQAQLARAEAVSRYLGDILLSPSANWDSNLQTGPEATIGDVLLAAEAQLDQDLVDFPEVRIELYQQIGEGLARVGDQRAIGAHRKALDLARATQPETSPLLVDAIYSLASTYQKAGQAERASAVFAEAWALANTQTDQTTLRKLYILNDWAVANGELGRAEEGRRQMQQALDGVRELYGDSLLALHTNGYSNLGLMDLKLGQLTRARASFETAIQAHELYPEQTEGAAGAIYSHMATLQLADGDRAGYLANLYVSLEKYVSALGERHEDVAVTSSMLAAELAYQGEVAEASRRVEAIGRDFADYLGQAEAWPYYFAQARLAMAQGRCDAALAHYRTIREFDPRESQIAPVIDVQLYLVSSAAQCDCGDSEQAAAARGSALSRAVAWVGEEAPYAREVAQQMKPCN